MPLLVVGSVALDSVHTPREAREDVLGGSAVYFSYAASFFTSVRLVGVVGEDWPRGAHPVPAIAADRHQRLAGGPGRQDVSLARQVRDQHERSPDAGSPPERAGRFRSGPAGRLQTLPVRVPGQRVPAGPDEGPGPGDRPAAGGGRHDGLVDSRSSRRTHAAVPPRRRPGDERQRGQAADRGREPGPGRTSDPGTGAQVRGDQEGRTRGHVLFPVRDLRPAGLSRRSKSSIPPAPATASRAA